MITFRTASDLGIKITHPFHNLSSGLHIPYFARPHRSFDDEYGISRAQDLLEELYELGAFIQENLPELKTHYALFKVKTERVSREFINAETLANRKRELKALLRAGEIDGRQYQQTLDPLNKERNKVLLMIALAGSDFCEEYFPMGVSIDTQDDVFSILEDKKSLMAPDN